MKNKDLSIPNREFLLSYLASIGKDAVNRIRIERHEALTSAECFRIDYYSPTHNCKVPFYFAKPEIDRLEGDFSRIIGRTPWGGWALCSLYKCTLITTKPISETRGLTRSEIDHRLLYLKEYIKNYI